MSLFIASALADDQNKKQASLSSEEIRAKRLQRLSPADVAKALSSPEKSMPNQIIKPNDIINLLDSDDESDDEVVILETPPAWASLPPKNESNKRASNHGKSATVPPKKIVKTSISLVGGSGFRSSVNADFAMVAPKIPEGASLLVQGTTGSIYTVKNVGGVYSCSCPAWRVQKKTINNRTCKHLIQYLGKEFTNQVSNGSIEVTNAKTKSTAQGNKTIATGMEAEDALLFSKDLMLARKWEEKHGCQGYLMSEKLDGWRCLWNGKRMITRHGKSIDAPDWFLKGFPSNMALDGELFCDRQEIQLTSAILQSSSTHPGKYTFNQCLLL
jgi:hypothetical protein